MLLSPHFPPSIHTVSDFPTEVPLPLWDLRMILIWGTIFRLNELRSCRITQLFYQTEKSEPAVDLYLAILSHHKKNPDLLPNLIIKTPSCNQVLKLCFRMFCLFHPLWSNIYFKRHFLWQCPLYVWYEIINWYHT